jgi:NADH:ubiquinone oxidoreductase subunit 5 (subunit L)/multisubunit Na+/H+ antiporter MnhA subunit
LCAALAFSLSSTTLILFFGWMGVGLMFYALYGIRKSKLHGHVGRAAQPLRDVDAEIVLEEIPPPG